jgi:hypothetical protein
MHLQSDPAEDFNQISGQITNQMKEKQEHKGGCKLMGGFFIGKHSGNHVCFPVHIRA